MCAPQWPRSPPRWASRSAWAPLSAAVQLDEGSIGAAKSHTRRSVITLRSLLERGRTEAGSGRGGSVVQPIDEQGSRPPNRDGHAGGGFFGRIFPRGAL